MKRSKRYWRSYHPNAGLLGILVLCLVFLFGCSAAHVIQSKKQTGNLAVNAAQQTKHVETTIITKRQIANFPKVSAALAPSESLDVIAKTGGTVRKILKRRGEVVHTGDVLLKLSSSDARYQREQAMLSLKTVQNELALAKRSEGNKWVQAERQVSDLTKNYNILRNNYDEGLATKTELDQAKSQLGDARTALSSLNLSNGLNNLEVQLKAAQFALGQANKAIAALDVKAPISGILTNLSIEAGMDLGGNTKVGVVQKLDPIKITAQITAQDAKLVNGKKVLAYFISGTTKKRTGKISYLADIADPKTQLYELDLEAPNKGMALKPGMKVQIQLGSDQSVVTVPSYSIVREGADTYVFVLVNGVAEKRKVQLGRLSGPNQEVISGVKAGEMLVTSGQNNLKDGEKVDLSSVQTVKK